MVVLYYFVMVIAQRSDRWYEWFAALAGVAFAAWFWFTEVQRARRRRDR